MENFAAAEAFLDGKIADDNEEAAVELRRVRRALQTQEEPELLQLFDDSLRLYASELESARKVCAEMSVAPRELRNASGDEEVTRITRAVQALDLVWSERMGRRVQRNTDLYASG
jgi:hypothetical protein